MWRGWGESGFGASRVRTQIEADVAHLREMPPHLRKDAATSAHAIGRLVPYRLPGDELVHACCCALAHAAHIMVTASTSTSEFILCARFGDAMVIRQAAGHLNDACAIVDDGLAAIDTLPGARPAASNCRFEAAGRALFAWHRAAHPAHAVGCRRRRGFPGKHVSPQLTRSSLIIGRATHGRLISALATSRHGFTIAGEHRCA